MTPKPDFEKEGGLIPAIAQDYETGEVLMLAWMNEDAWNASLEEGAAVYWSRSRSRLWRKGETSGRIQKIREIYLDCDRDSVLLKVDQIGEAACHTGRRTCFHNKVENGSLVVTGKPLFDPTEVYKDK